MNLIRSGFLFFVLISFWACNPTNPGLQDASAVMNACFSYHDPEGNWPDWAGEYLVIEPRLQNPGRRSAVVLNEAKGNFEMERIYGADTLKWTISAGTYQGYVNGHAVRDSSRIQQYRLTPERHEVYHNFFAVLLGLPMSIKGKISFRSAEASLVEWQGEAALRLDLQIEGAPFAEHWEIFVDSEDYRLLGFGFFPEDGEGEYLSVNEMIEVGGMKFPRIRNWYARKDHQYLGSDIILKVSPLHE